MQQGDIGAPIRATLKANGAPLPLSNETVVELWIRLPKGRTLRRVMAIEDAEAGKVEYLTAAGDLPEFGRYRFQVRALLPDGPLGFELRDEEVFPNLYPTPVHMLPAPAVLRLGALELGLS